MSADPNRIILDHAEPLSISGQRIVEEQQQAEALRRLSFGLNFLYRTVKEQEEKLTRATGGHIVLAHSGRGFAEHGVEGKLVYNAFDWYAINASRYFQLIGFISDQYQGPEVVRLAKAYRTRVCGSVQMYRDKVAAHFALTSPMESGVRRDNAADLSTSTMLTFLFMRDRFVAGALTRGVGVGEEHVRSQHDIEWSLTRFHEDVLTPRIMGSQAPAPRSRSEPRGE